MNNQRQKLLDSYPKRENFPNQQEFEEALGYWQENQGRNLAMLDRRNKNPPTHQEASQPTEQRPPSPEEIAMHDEVKGGVMAYLTKKYPSPTEPTSEPSPTPSNPNKENRQ